MISSSIVRNSLKLFPQIKLQKVYTIKPDERTISFQKTSVSIRWIELENAGVECFNFFDSVIFMNPSFDTSCGASKFDNWSKSKSLFLIPEISSLMSPNHCSRTKKIRVQLEEQEMKFVLINILTRAVY